MTWQTAKLACESVALLVVAGSAIVFAWESHQVAVQVSTTLSGVSLLEGNVDHALSTINHPCAPGPCGTLATIDKTVTKIGDAVVTTQLAERQTIPHVTAAMDTFNLSAAKFGNAADSLAGTASAATGTAQALTATLGTANQTIKAMQEPVRAFTADATDLDALLKNPSIPETLTNAQGITWNLNEVTFDAKRISDDATKKYFTPEPWYRKALPWATTGAKIAAYALPWP